MKILVLSAHSDDAVFTAGGTISKLHDLNNQIYFLALSAANKSLPAHYEHNTLQNECGKAAETLGVTKVYFKDFPVRQFPQHRQEVLEAFIETKKEVKPDVVFSPVQDDLHQDHQVVNREAVRAFRSCSIYGYDFPWNSLYGQKLNLFFMLNEQHLNRKIEAVNCFKSQISKNRPYLTEEYIRSVAVERGSRVGAKYAEAFAVIRQLF